jgi:hypothetical protein
LPFPVPQGAWTGHPYRVTFKETAARRSQVGLFRSWLKDKSRETTTYLQRQTAELRS